MRPLYRWPAWWLRVATFVPVLAGWAWLELHHRRVDAVRDAANNETGPWPVAMPRGIQ